MLNRFDEILEEAAVQKDDSAIQDESGSSQTECLFLCPQLNAPEVNLHGCLLYYTCMHKC